MIQEYKFFGEDALKFEDSKAVRELLEYAFEQFGYYEPFGMDAVAIYQTGFAHFTLDTSRKCCEEIKDPDGLCFACHIPGFLYYAEGGWGHHMSELSNHPAFCHPVSLKLKFEDFNHTVVFEGTHSFREVPDSYQRMPTFTLYSICSNYNLSVTLLQEVSSAFFERCLKVPA